MRGGEEERQGEASSPPLLIDASQVIIPPPLMWSPYETLGVTGYLPRMPLVFVRGRREDGGEGKGG